MKRLHAFVSGKVQGVFFRESTRKAAVSLNVVGYAKNLSDGRVEIVAEGEEHALDSLVQFLNVGPETAQVERVEFEIDDFTEGFETFQILG